MKNLPNTITPIADDIFQVRLPLPFALNHVNCYLLKGDNGWTILDTGLNIPEARAGWQAAFSALAIDPDDIEQIILTHVHPDHYGLSGWLQQWCGAAVWVSPREAELEQQMWKAVSLHDVVLDMLALSGVAPQIREGVGQATGKTRKLTLPHPTELKILTAGTTLSLGQRAFTALHAPGHSDGQLIFYDAADRLLLVGDQVLLKITPNIGLWPMTEPDPLGRYLNSLAELLALDVRLALPGHGPLITDWRGRITELQQHHQERLEIMLAAINGDTTPFQVSQHVFDFQKLGPHEIRFAVAETLAHLDYLVDRQRLHRRQNGVLTYHSI